MVGLSGANVPDVTTLEYLVSSLPHIGGRRGPPAHKLDRLHADKGCASKKNRRLLAKIGVKCRIARKGVESAAHLGRHRWVVERTIAWFHRFTRLRTRYERSPETHIAFMLLAAVLICWRQVTGRAMKPPLTESERCSSHLIGTRARISAADMVTLVVNPTPPSVAVFGPNPPVAVSV